MVWWFLLVSYLEITLDYYFVLKMDSLLGFGSSGRSGETSSQPIMFARETTPKHTVMMSILAHAPVSLLARRYISDPLTVGGYKADLRL